MACEKSGLYGNKGSNEKSTKMWKKVSENPSRSYWHAGFMRSVTWLHIALCAGSHRFRTERFPPA